MANTHDQLVSEQFGPQARAYVASAVHASGEDLDWIEANLKGRGAATLIDIGCGGGHVGYRAAAHVGSVTACDLSPDMLRAVEATARARGLANLRTAQAYAEHLPFGEGAFDVATTRLSAHHWGDLDGALREVARVLKPGGLFLAVDTIAPPHPLLDTYLQSVELLRDPSHVRDYAAAEWTAALGCAGLAVGELRTSRIRIEFASWVERMRTPDSAAAMIRELQEGAPVEVRRHFGVEADGSFWLDTVWIAATHP